MAAKAKRPAIPSAAVVCRKIFDIGDVWFAAEVVMKVGVTSLVSAGPPGVTVSMATEVDVRLLSICGKKKRSEKILD